MMRKRSLDTHTLDMFETGLAQAEPLTAQNALQVLKQWADAGMLRRLDVALAVWLHEQFPQVQPCVLVAAAMLAHMEGRGHSCLPLNDMVVQANAVLGWDTEDVPHLEALWALLPHTPREWLQALQNCPLVRHASEADRAQPLVLAALESDFPLLYLRRYWDYERTVAAHILQRSATAGVQVPEQAAQTWLNSFFPPSSRHSCNWQKVACAVALRGRFSVITGGPGTGKTHTAARLLALLFATAPNAQQLRVALAAPTGKAAARLKQSIGSALGALQDSVGDALDLQALVQRVGAARTLHSLLGARPGTRRWGFHAGQPLDVDVLIVDEASMVHLEMMAALLDALPPQARLVLLGDKDQLASVEAGAVLGDLCRDAQPGRYSADTVAYVQRVTGDAIPVDFHAARDAPALAQHTVMLRKSHRFDGPIAELALAVNAGNVARSLELLAHSTEHHPVFMQADGPVQNVHAMAWEGRGDTAGEQPLAVGYRPFGQLLMQWAALEKSPDFCALHATWVRQVLEAFDRFRLLCAVREGEWGVAGLNTAVQRLLSSKGVIPKAPGEWYRGRPVMVTRNDAALGVFNGDIGVALPSAADGHPLRVYFLHGSELRSVSVARLAHVETAFAMTVHKSQGSEFAHTALVLSAKAGGVLGRELVYTGITRAKQAFTLLAEDGRLLAQAIASPTRRASGLLRFLEGEFEV